LREKGHEKGFAFNFFDIELTFITATWHVAFCKGENKRHLKVLKNALFYDIHERFLRDYFAALCTNKALKVLFFSVCIEE
jgi:hypothetical protein